MSEFVEWLFEPPRLAFFVSFIVVGLLIALVGDIGYIFRFFASLFKKKPDD